MEENKKINFWYAMPLISTRNMKRGFYAPSPAKTTQLMLLSFSASSVVPRVSGF